MECRMFRYQGMFENDNEDKWTWNIFHKLALFLLIFGLCKQKLWFIIGVAEALGLTIMYGRKRQDQFHKYVRPLIEDKLIVATLRSVSQWGHVYTLYVHFITSTCLHECDPCIFFWDM